MALFNEILAGRFNKALTKLFSMKGGAPASQLAGEIMPGINFPWGNDLRYLEGWYRFGASVTGAAVAAQFGRWRFRNPTGSNVIFVVERLRTLTSSVDTSIQLFGGAQSVDLATVASLALTRFDPRGNPAPTAIISTDNNAAQGAFGATFLQMSVPVVGTPDEAVLSSSPDVEITVLPGDALQVSTGIVNNQLNVACWWRERLLEESERF